MLYALRAFSGQIKIRILYWNAGSYRVYIDGKEIPQNDWVEDEGGPALISYWRKEHNGCGENRFKGGTDNYLEFVLSAQCELNVKPIDSFPCNVRMDWTLAEFYNKGGHTKFADRIAAVLGIHASRIKTVAVYTGSVIVDFVVEAEELSGDDDDDADNS